MSASRVVPIDEGASAVLEARARELAAPVDRAVDPGEMHLVLRVGGGRLSVPARRASHVGALAALTPVPGAPTAVRGIAAVLGRLVPVVDLAALLGVERAARRGLERIVVVERDQRPLGLLVEAVEDLVPLEDSVPEHGAGADGLATARPRGPRALHVDAIFDALQGHLPPGPPAPPTRGAT